MSLARGAQPARQATLGLLQQWDKGSKKARERILRDFIEIQMGKTAPELEQELSHSAGLMLARIVAWMQLTYLTGGCLGLQLKATSVFLSSSNGCYFVDEFVEMGAVRTVLDTLAVRLTKDVDRVEGLSLLRCIASHGRLYKEIICKSYGVEHVCNCLSESNSENVQLTAKQLLDDLSGGNPSYQEQVYRGFVQLLGVPLPNAQRLAANSLRTLQPLVSGVHPTMVANLLTMLRCLQLEVQEEAFELAMLLIDHGKKSVLLEGLIGLLKPQTDSGTMFSVIRELDVNDGGAVPWHIQQAAAARLITVLCRGKDGKELTEHLLKLNVVEWLLVALGNVQWADSRHQASKALQFFIHCYSDAERFVSDQMGRQFSDQLASEPERVALHLTPVQAETLRNCAAGVDRKHAHV